jgi:hypothetical protein
VDSVVQEPRRASATALVLAPQPSPWLSGCG